MVKRKKVFDTFVSGKSLFIKGFIDFVVLRAYYSLYYSERFALKKIKLHINIRKEPANKMLKISISHGNSVLFTYYEYAGI